MLKVGLSLNGTGAKAIDRGSLAKMKAAGIEAVEISLGRDATRTLDYAALRRDADAADIEIWSMHLPFMPFAEIDVSANDEALRKSSVTECAEIIRHGAEIGIDKFIIHPSAEPIEEAQRGERLAAAKRSLAELAEVSSECGATLCVENLPRTCLGRDSSDILALLSADARLRVCFDTNHLLEEDILSFIRAVGDRIVTLHVSDYDRLNERHWLPGEGCIDWHTLYSALLGEGYSGSWLYEISLEPQPTITRPRDLDYSDITRNATEVAEGGVIPPFGTPKAGLTSWK